jgi:hypothetical protein
MKTEYAAVTKLVQDLRALTGVGRAAGRGGAR